MNAHDTVEDTTIAVVGMSCRFAPNLDTPEKFWEFITQGSSAIGDMPVKRWSAYAETNPQATAALRGTTLLGSYLDDIEGFDAEFFQITPKEAEYLDPQQRFMLELTWEALVSAGIAPSSLAGSDAGVYAAVNSTDYGRRVLEDLARTGPYAVNGTTDYGIANRVSYFLDLHGPSMAVNTACAASLTALHVAGQALAAQEIPLAIVGGMNIISTPALNVALQGAGALAPDGRSKAYDDAADGYGRGEGAGVVVLKRYADAVADGDRVLGLIRGSGVFQDGRSEGMMAPNAAAQEHMLRRIYERAGVDPASVGYVEAHGTGTPTGDGTELRALAAVFGRGRDRGDVCRVGSVKPNVGHVEGGSGMVGVIKVILSFLKESIPPSVHGVATTSVDWDAAGLSLVAAAASWPRGGAPRRAGVSNYGVGGTIAHLILEEAPLRVPQDAGELPGPVMVPVSAASDAGARELARWVSDALIGGSGFSLRDVAHTLARRRSHLGSRVAVVASTLEELGVELARAGAQEASPNGVAGRGSGKATQPVWVFSGHGAQWAGMARDLIDTDEAFTRALDGVGEVFLAELGWTPREALLQRETWSSADVQVLTVATQMALAAAWRARGVTPGAVIGHSVGEIAAAVTAGVLDPVEAVRFACRRARALDRLAGRGAMVMASLSGQECQERLGQDPDAQVAIYASAASTVVSGSPERIAQITEQWGGEGIQMRPVASDIAFHSAQVGVIVGEVRRAAEAMTVRAPHIPLYSTAVEDPRSQCLRDGEYWATNLAAPVRFDDAVAAAMEDGHRVFLEVSTHPVVGHSILETAVLDGYGDDVTVVGSLRRDTPDRVAMARGFAGLYAAGCDIDFTESGEYDGDLVDLPAMAWQHRNYWLFDGVSDHGVGGGHDPAKHSLLGGLMTVSGTPTRHVWQTRLDMDSRPYPLNHALVGVEVTPAASLLNSFFQAAEIDTNATVVDVGLRTPLAVEPARIVQVVREGNTLSLSSRVAEAAAADSGAEWITHCTATIDPHRVPPTGRIDANLRDELPEWPEEEVHEMFRRAGVGGYAFSWELEELRRGSDAQFAVMDLQDGASPAETSWAHVIDAALTISAALVTPVDADGLWMSQSIAEVAVAGAPPPRIMVASYRTPGTSDASVDVVISDDTGAIVAEVRGLKFSAVDTLGHATSPKELTFEPTWQEGPTPTPVATLDGRRILIVGDDTEELATCLQERGGTITCATSDTVTSTDLDTIEEVLLLPSPDVTDAAPGSAAATAAWRLVETTQVLLSTQIGGNGTGPRLWAVTRGVRELATSQALTAAPVWGAARIIAGEHPELWGGVIDIDTLTPQTAATVAALISQPAPDADVLAVAADGSVWVEKLAPITRPADKDPLVCSPGGSVLITGGLGDLGLDAARWLVERGARRIVLASRRTLPPRNTWDGELPATQRDQVAAIQALEAMGVSVHILPVDFADPDAVRRAFSPGNYDLPPITGIIHAAGVVADDLVDNLPRTAIDTVFGAKATGAWTLHEIFPPGTLDFFILFSSCGQLARLSGQTAYAAGNSYLDALARLRWAHGDRATVSLAWTSWRGRGLSRDLTTTMLEANTRGLDAISRDEALRAWSFSDRFASPYFAIMRVLPPEPWLPRPPALHGLTGAPGQAPETGDPVHDLDMTLPMEETRAAVADRVRREVAAELHADRDSLDIRRPLVEMGVDSVMAVALRVRLTRAFGLEFAPTILWAKPTVAELADDIHTRLRREVAPDESAEPALCTATV